MISSDNTPPSIDGLEELDATLGGQPPLASLAAPVQTDIEDFTGPTPQPLTVESAKCDSRPATKAKPKSAPEPRRKATSAKRKTARKSMQKAKHAVSPTGQTHQDSAPADFSVNAASSVQHDTAEPKAAESTVSEPPQNGAMPQPQATGQQAVSQPVNTSALPRPLGHVTSTASDVPLQALGSYLELVAKAIARVTQAPKSIILSSLLSVLALIAHPPNFIRSIPPLLNRHSLGRPALAPEAAKPLPQ